MNRIRLFPVAGVYGILILLSIIACVIYDWWKIPLGYIESTEFGFSAFASFIGGFSLALIVFVLLRPRIAIAPRIAQKKDNDTGETFYTFKFVNNSIFPAFDVKIESYLCAEENATINGEGVNTRLTSIILTRKEWMFIPGWRLTREKTRYAPHCVTVRTFHENLPIAIYENSEYLIFRVTLKHAFSNLSSTYRSMYKSDGSIVKGKFKFGNTFKIE